MQLYTYANHLWWSINDKKFKKREATNDRFVAGVGTCEQLPKSFHEECIYTAHTIRATTTKDIIVLFSGGVDGEVVVRSFHEAKIPFTPIIYRYRDNANEHEYKFAINACNELNIPYELIDLDVIKLWENDYAKDDFYTPVMSLVKYTLDNFQDCYSINGFMPPYFKKETNNWYFYIRELSLFPIWYSIEKNIHTCGSFFLYRPENLLAMLGDKLITDIIANITPIEQYHHPLNHLRGEFLAKFAFFEKHFPGMEWRPKYIGYEREKDRYKSMGRKMLEHGPLAKCIRDSTTMLEVNELKKYLTSKISS